MIHAVSWAVGRCMFWAGFFEPICKNSTSLVTSKPCRVRQCQSVTITKFLQRYCTTDEDRISHASVYWCGQETQWTWDSVYLALNSDCAKDALVADELIQASTKGIDSCLNLIFWSIESSLKQTRVALHCFPNRKGSYISFLQQAWDWIKHRQRTHSTRDALHRMPRYLGLQSWSGLQLFSFKIMT